MCCGQSSFRMIFMGSGNFARNSLKVFQVVNMDRWNCNVFAYARIMTVGNYVRICLGCALWRVGLVACPRASLDASALMGGLHYMKPAVGVSSACRSLM